MTEQEIKLFNKLADKVCENLKSKDECYNCPFHQWDGYFECQHQLDKDASEILLKEDK